MQDWERLLDYWPHLAVLFTAVLTLTASIHAILHKRDTRAAIAWVGVIWLTPVVGTLFYVLLGINRIRRKAKSLRADQPVVADLARLQPSAERELQQQLPEHYPLRTLARLTGEVTHRPLLAANLVEPLVNSVEAYPAMLAAIDAAERSIALSSYIFNNDPTGKRFADALARAAARGVQVRVLIDDIGARYTWPSIVRALKRGNVPVARFLPTLVPGWSAYSNLRSHRKILVVDGRVGFTGGMNIRESEHFKVKRTVSIQDLHCRIEGPVVAHLAQVFAEDWEFTTAEVLRGDIWFPALEPRGCVFARGISDGPDEDLDKLRLTLLGGLTCAQSKVQIVTPYFLPDQALITALNVAAMRGVEVDIILPEQNNLVLVQWASTALLWQLLEYGCRVWLSAPPFDHTKLMVLDRSWSLLGSGNWDPRSLRLNFEFNVECYDTALANRLERIVDSKLQRARQVTLAEVDGRRFLIRLRDGVARLLSPYL